jgi:hypothetical protein
MAKRMTAAARAEKRRRSKKKEKVEKKFQRAQSEMPKSN